MSQRKHLTHEERVIIEDRLNHNYSLRHIASELGKSPSTIMREIDRYVQEQSSTMNDCVSRDVCDYHNRCPRKDCKRKCVECKSVHCKNVCEDYEPKICHRLKKSPHVCNGCSRISSCHAYKRVYKASKAQRLYKTILSESRQGYDLTAEQLSKVNELASPLIKQGCSPYHIKETYGNELPVSEATLRRMIGGGVLDARNIDLREQVKRKPRKTTKNKDRIAQLTVSKIGHLYKDYLNYIKENDVITVEMDCVEGKQDETETLLTLHFKEMFLQLAFIMEDQTSNDVVGVLDKIEETLGTELFKTMFPLILTDNGHEFSDINRIERSINGGKRTSVYYCEPNHSEEKGSCENHHKMIRYCIPKGSSLAPYNQIDISLMMNHINSYRRKKLYGKSAYQLAKGFLPEDFFILLGLEEIPDTEIVLQPSLFGK